MIFNYFNKINCYRSLTVIDINLYIYDHETIIRKYTSLISLFHKFFSDSTQAAVLNINQYVGYTCSDINQYVGYTCSEI